MATSGRDRHGESHRPSQSRGGNGVELSPSLVCVECGMPVSLLFRQYTKGNIRLGRCVKFLPCRLWNLDTCSSVADKYIEYEFVLIAIDLALHRIQAYRHLLFNREPFSTYTFNGRLWQLGVAMAALDAYLRLAALSASPILEYQGKHTCAAEQTETCGGGSSLATEPLIRAGGVFITALVEHICFAAGVVWCACWENNKAMLEGGADGEGLLKGWEGGMGWPKGSEKLTSPTRWPSKTKVFMAVVYPLFFRLLAAFVMIWDRQVAILNTIGLLVLTMQYVALTAVVAGWPRGRGTHAAAAVSVGMAAKMLARAVIFFVAADVNPRAFHVL